MSISIVAAVSNNFVIGQNNQLPWRLPADLAYFKKLTVGKTVVMGRKTYESLGKPLPQRHNIVITRDPDYQAPGCELFHSLESVLERHQDDDLMIIGGASLYELALPLASYLYLTFVDVELEGDSYFPRFNRDDWVENSNVYCPKDDKNIYDCSFVCLVRK